MTLTNDNLTITILSQKCCQLKRPNDCLAPAVDFSMVFQPASAVLANAQKFITFSTVENSFGFFAWVVLLYRRVGLSEALSLLL